MMREWDGGSPNPIVGFSNIIYVWSEGKGGRDLWVVQILSWLEWDA